MQASLTNPQTQELAKATDGGFESVDVLTFSKDTLATGIHLRNFVLDGNFTAMDINVLASGSPIAAQLEKPDANTWIVRLPRALPLKRINVQELQFSQKFAAEPFIEAGYFDYLLPELQLSVGAAVVLDDRVSQVRAEIDTRLKSGKALAINAGSLDIYPVVGDKIMEQSIATVGNNGIISDLVLESFAVRARDAISYSSLLLQSASHTISVYIDSQPQGVKLGLVPVVGGEPQVAAFSELPGISIASNQPAVHLDVTSEKWCSALQNYLDTQFQASDNTTYQIGLVMRSENPCRFERSLFTNEYQLVFRNLQSAAGDAVESANPHSKNFDGTHWQSDTFLLQIPQNSVLDSVVLPFKHTCSKNPFVFVDDAPPVHWLTTAKGVELSPDQWTGGVFELPRAQAVRYLLAPLMATAQNSVCSLEIREDVNGKPAGSILTAQTIPLPHIGRAAWMAVALDEPLKLYNKKLWWLLKTTQGSAVQLVEQNTEGAGISHFALTESGGPGRVFRVTREQKVRPFFAKEHSEGFRLHAFSEEAGSWIPLGLNTEKSENLQRFDVLPSLPGLSNSVGGTVSVRLASLLKGKVEVYPAEIRYELAPLL